MATQWFAAQAFETDQKVLEAINSVSLTLNLCRVHHRPDDKLAERAQRAIDILRVVLESLRAVQAKDCEAGVPVGVDVYYRQLATSLDEARGGPRFLSALVTHGAGAFLDQFEAVIATGFPCPADGPALAPVLDGLRDLRDLIKRHDRGRNKDMVKGL